MFTPEEQQSLQQLRSTCKTVFETHIKQLKGGYLLSTVERFVNHDETIIAQATHTKICSNVLDVPNEIFNIYVGVPAVNELDDSKVEYLKPVGAESAEADDTRIG